MEVLTSHSIHTFQRPARTQPAAQTEPTLDRYEPSQQEDMSFLQDPRKLFSVAPPDATDVARPRRVPLKSEASAQEKASQGKLSQVFLGIQGKASEAVLKLKKLADTHPRLNGAVAVFSKMVDLFGSAAGLIAFGDIAGTISKVTDSFKTLFDEAVKLARSGLPGMSSHLIKGVVKCVPWLGAGLSCYDGVKNVMDAAEQARKGNKPAAAAHACLATLDFLSATLNMATGLAVAGGITAPLAAGLETSVVVCQLVGVTVSACLDSP